MPLAKGKSKATFKKNLKTEMKAGKPQSANVILRKAKGKKAKKK